MAGLVNEILTDLGLYGNTPTTFPELITWIASISVAAVLIAGFIKLYFWVIAVIGKGGIV